MGENTRYASLLRQKVPEAKSIGRRGVATTRNTKFSKQCDGSFNRFDPQSTQKIQSAFCIPCGCNAAPSDRFCLWHLLSEETCITGVFPHWMKAKHFAKSKTIICDTFLYTKIRHFALRGFHWIFEIYGGEGTFIYKKKNSLCVTFFISKKRCTLHYVAKYKEPETSASGWQQYFPAFQLNLDIW